MKETNTGLMQDTAPVYDAVSAYDTSYLDVVTTGERGTPWSATVAVNGSWIPGLRSLRQSPGLVE